MLLTLDTKDIELANYWVDAWAAKRKQDIEAKEYSMAMQIDDRLHGAKMICLAFGQFELVKKIEIILNTQTGVQSK